jgi:hypothetical protein
MVDLPFGGPKSFNAELLSGLCVRVQLGGVRLLILGIQHGRENQKTHNQ